MVLKLKLCTLPAVECECVEEDSFLWKKIKRLSKQYKITRYDSCNALI